MSRIVNSHGYAVDRFQFLEGKLLTIIEACGLQKSQEEAVKGLVKSEIWKMWDYPDYDEDKTHSDGVVEGK